MKRASPPKHRHDGTSPLPLGMDWSPPPKKWEGRNTVWPHDPRTGWSYCVMVPSWVVQTKSKASTDSLLNPIIFYRIQVGIQSPEGVSYIHGILHRFSDFLELYSSLKRAFPKKDIPPAPPKHTLLRINSSRLLLEERRRALEEWMGKLLSDIDLSRSAPVAAFLELEVAARSSFQDTSQLSLETRHLGEASFTPSSPPERTGSGASVAGSSAVASNCHSATSDMGSDYAYETSDVGTSSQGIVHASDTRKEYISSVHDFSAPIAEVSNGVLMGESALNRQEEFLRIKLQQRKESLSIDGESFYGNPSREASLSRERIEFMPEQDHDKLSGHSRKLSVDSICSDASSLRGSELSVPGGITSVWDGSVDLTGREAQSGISAEFVKDAQIILPLDQRHKLNRVLVTMHQRLLTAKTDMEDLIARLNQEMTVKEYLATKVKDLEGELEATKQKSKENLQQAMLIERERVTQMQWDMDELRRKYIEMESKLKIEQSEKTRAESEKLSASSDKDLLLEDLDSKQEQIDKLQRHLEDVEMKSKADIKVLVKEVKFLRNSQRELKEMLNQSMKEKADLEKVLQSEKQKSSHSKSSRKKLLHECEVLRHRLQECSIEFLAEGEDKFTVNSSSLSDALDLLATSDNRIGLLLAEAQLLAQDDEHAISDREKSKSTASSENLTVANGDDSLKADDETRRMLTETLIDNAKLRKQVNSVLRCAFKTVAEPEKGDGEVASKKSVLNRFFER
ncbi:PX domain-containing protein EREL1 isoform X1 [Asparagus officinalis]|uniref:PX domain-containing protein EREL1 isoform X1 n=2 Tax=Asparagus officinalis TaxID=4686 RepID=UPI00098E7393|nr:PX domain-containing protein EREL1 isoform X1 [Asparagus officinalis]